MTGYTVHTGSSEKFASGWDQVFSGGGQGAAKSAKGKKATVARAPAKKATAKKGARKVKRGK